MVHVNVNGKTAGSVQSGSVEVPVVPAGIGSSITTPAGSVEGPLFVIVMVYVVEVPAIIDATPSDFTIDRSADVVTASVSVAVLFAALGSRRRARM